MPVNILEFIMRIALYNSLHGLRKYIGMHSLTLLMDNDTVSTVNKTDETLIYPSAIYILY